MLILVTCTECEQFWYFLLRWCVSIIWNMYNIYTDMCVCVYPIGLFLSGAWINTLGFSLSSFLPQGPLTCCSLCQELAFPWSFHGCLILIMCLYSGCFLFLEVFHDHMNKTPAPTTPQTLMLHQDTLFIFFLSHRPETITICVIFVVVVCPLFSLVFHDKRSKPLILVHQWISVLTEKPSLY